MSGANGGRGRGGRKSSGRTGRESSAGGVVFRVAEGRALFLLICDSYGNWGFPKGHLERGELKDISDVRPQFVEIPARQSRDLESVHPDLALIGLEQPDDVLDRDRLARARESNDYDSLTLGDVESEPLQHALRPEGFVDVDEFDHGLRAKC